ncbi:MAG: SIS domain-containing protein [Fibrobacteria bacterium]|nr:SIS domain-containing protein [Fibrobacteria bacterium]
MKTSIEKYNNFALCREMLETGEVVKNLNLDTIFSLVSKINKEKIFFTGEGSSRIFPAKKTICDAWANGYPQPMYTEAATQALEYKLADSAVFVASNSGKTKEGVRIIRHLKAQNHSTIIGVIANDGTPIQQESDAHYLLGCGKEDAVAATKSVVEQALFYDLLFRKINGLELPDLQKLGDLITQVLEMEVSEEISGPLMDAAVLYWAGRNNGAAEELTLKTNEITRKKSDFLEGTYAAHGIEEVMNKNEALIIVDPFKDEEEKFTEVLNQGVGLPIVAISDHKTSFPTMIIPAYGQFTPYLQLVAGWSLLVEVGINAGIDLDKPERARKVGNEFLG